jgi:hypothetical protein
MTEATFTEPAPYGYLYAGLRVDPPARVPFVRRSARRAEAIRRCKDAAASLMESPDVVAATVYEAVLIPPAANHPRFDVLVLVETTTPETITGAEAFRALGADVVMGARNVRRIGDIDRSRTGAFLFNHFTAENFDRALRTWEPIAGWFTHRAGVDDSALLEPVEASPYVFVNHVRLPCSPVRFFLRLLKPSFRESVSRQLRANGIGFAAVACKAVWSSPFPEGA